MFSFVEKNKTAVQVVLGLVSLGLVVGVGLTGYSAMEGGESYLAKVGQTKITPRELAQAIGNRAVPNEMKPMVLEQLVKKQLLLEQAGLLHLDVSDDQIRNAIAAIPDFQENGKFSAQRYKDLLAAQQMTPLDFQQRVRDDIASSHLLAGFSSGIQSTAVADYMAGLLGEKRDVAMLQISPAAFLPQVTVSDAEVKKYYDTHSAEFKLPEMARLEYLVFSQQELAKSISISPDEVKKYFEAHQAQLTGEERKASHILIALAKDAKPEAKKAAQAKAEAILLELKANPARFADLAKKESQDPGSAANGGDLGFFAHGAMVKPFDDAAFKLKKGEISGIVASDFGLHIIRLDDVRSKTFAEVQPDVEQKLKLEKVSQSFQKQAERFNELVYQQADSLKPAAEAFKLHVQQSDWLTRAAAKDELLNNEKLREAAFSDDVLKKKHNSEAIEVASGTLVSVRVIESKPAQSQKLEAVSADIIAKLKQEKALKLAIEEGTKKLADLKKGGADTLTWPAAQAMARMGQSAVPEAQVKEIFRAAADKLPAYAGAEVKGQGFALFKVVKSTAAPALDATMRRQLNENMVQMYGQVEVASYLQALKSQIKVDYKLKAMAAE
ncbi:peptidylprolyl isomerase [Iodobacter fluviatilis]|uniref:Periplasmic chaperone PpiD n=1 Tax=Iodobacter fluviatilis TaxID=537 RepID=A0A377QAQ8_9NEIS|nr:SurA N-terminal domain-containing protein [Iodobacter fluviatilis]TCU83698.1 peptidyl-prolyl cis-trans isomerase D [Iodobacter fluviatilis]STQ91795.1 Peptidyl-prolyl cis-trans isomerase D [Iodobacter fluviatilis]